MQTLVQRPGGRAFFDEIALKLRAPRVDTPDITFFQEARD
jgi:hypothetical protein